MSAEASSNDSSSSSSGIFQSLTGSTSSNSGVSSGSKSGTSGLTSMLPSFKSSASSADPTISDVNVISPDKATSFASVTSFFSSVTPTMWVVIILILAVLGFNIFRYLEKGTQGVADFFNYLAGSIGSYFGVNAGKVGSQTINVAATGAKATVSAVASGTNQALTSVQTATAPSGTNTSSNINTYSPPIQSQMQQKSQNLMQYQEDSLNKALNDATKTQEVEADDSMSTIQASSGKAGWCFLGEDRGVRNCVQIGVNDTCMSGNIFPSQDICINPTLRP